MKIYSTECTSCNLMSPSCIFSIFEFIEKFTKNHEFYPKYRRTPSQWRPPIFPFNNVSLWPALYFLITYKANKDLADRLNAANDIIMCLEKKIAKLTEWAGRQTDTAAMLKKLRDGTCQELYKYKKEAGELKKKSRGFKASNICRTVQASTLLAVKYAFFSTCLLSVIFNQFRNTVQGCLALN